MSTVRRTFSPWATNTDENNRWISKFHSTGGALCPSLCRSFFVNIVHIYRVSIRVRFGLELRLVVRDKTPAAFYIMLARPVGRFFTALQMNFPVMLIREDICGRLMGLCRYADIGIGLAPLVSPYL